MRVSRHAPWISHLLFAYDCLIFTQASKRGANRIAEVLELYNRGSGKLVNKSKSVIFFSANCVHEVKQEVHGGLQIPTEALGEKYLGLPTVVGKSSDGTFDHVGNRIKSFIHGWGAFTELCRSGSLNQSKCSSGADVPNEFL